MATKTRPVCGIVWQNGTAVFLARIPGWDGVALQAADVSAVEYTVSLVDENDRDVVTPVTGHEAVALTPADVLSAALVTGDDRWTIDATGYNFEHLLDTTAVEAFALAGRRYIVTYRVTPTGQPAIVVVFQLDCKVS